MVKEVRLRPVSFDTPHIHDARVGAVAHEVVRPVSLKCKGCIAPCCSGPVAPLLTWEEIQSGIYPSKIVSVPPSLRKLYGHLQGLFAMFVDPKKGCVWFQDGCCIHYKDRPKSCQIFDCREIESEPFKTLVKERFSGGKV